MTPLPVADLHKFWPWMRGGLLDVIEKSGSDWLPEDVYYALRSNNAAAFAIGQEDGFVICRVDLRPSGPALFVWALWAPGMYDQLHESVTVELVDLARRHNCEKIIHEGRRGWGRKGWKSTHCIYEMEL